MKLKKKNTAAIKITADELGEQYTGIREKITALGRQKDNIREDIVDLAEDVGVEEGKQTIVRGDKYIVGFITTTPTPVLDYKKLRQQISPDQWTQITQRIVDTELLETAIQTGKISRKIISRCLVKSDKTPQRRVLVSKIGEKRNEDQE